MTSKRRASLQTAKRIPLNLFLMALGSALCALSINGILVPKGFYGAGLTGIALLIHYAVPALSVALVYMILNIPIFALGWMYVGKRFFFYSLAGMFIFTAAVKWIRVPIPVEDPILSALFAGILMGTGSGVILRSQGSAGGLDVLSVILLKRFSIRLGSTILGFNLGVLTAGAILFSLELALFTLIYLYVNAHMVNLMVTGLSQRKAVHIISPHWEAISKGVMHDMRRGVTIIEGQGAYSKKPEKILYIIITFRELAELKSIIHRFDPNAFMVVSDTLEVMGLRIGNQPHW